MQGDYSSEDKEQEIGIFFRSRQKTGYECLGWFSFIVFCISTEGWVVLSCRFLDAVPVQGLSVGMQTLCFFFLFLTLTFFFSFCFSGGTTSLAMFSHCFSLRTMHVKSNILETQILVPGALLLPLGQCHLQQLLACSNQWWVTGWCRDRELWITLNTRDITVATYYHTCSVHRLRRSIAGLWAESEQNIFNLCLTSGDKFDVLNCDASPMLWCNICKLWDVAR